MRVTRVLTAQTVQIITKIITRLILGVTIIVIHREAVIIDLLQGIHLVIADLLLVALLAIAVEAEHLLQRDDFIPFLSSCLEECNLNPKHLELEITELVLITMMEKAESKIRELRRIDRTSVV